MNEFRRLTMVSVALLAAALVGGGAVAQARTVPSTDFGSGGRVGTIGQISYPHNSKSYVAVAGNGDIYVAAQTEGGEFPPVQLRRYLPSGTLDPSFGEGGAVVVTRFTGLNFQISALLVDTNGLPYLVGTSFGAQTAFAGPYPSGPIRPAFATVARYTTAGTLDPTYGTGGVALFDFGLPAIGPVYEKPTVYGTRAVIDQQNRVVLVASEQEIEARGGHSAFYENPKLVARLTTSGVLDPGFAEGGTYPIPSLAVEGLAVDGSGRIALALAPYGANQTKSFRLLRLLADGRPDEAKGSGGLRSYGGVGPARALALETNGDALVLGTSPDPKPNKGGTTTPVVKLGPEGFRSGTLGKNGRVWVHLPGHSLLSEVVSDRHGGAYLVGTLVTRPPGTRDWHKARRQGVVVHLLYDGALDPNFGDEGRLVVSSPGEALGKGAQLTAGGRRLLVNGLIGPRPGSSGAHQFLAEYNAPTPVVTYK